MLYCTTPANSFISLMFVDRQIIKSFQVVKSSVLLLLFLQCSYQLINILVMSVQIRNQNTKKLQVLFNILEENIFILFEGYLLINMYYIFIFIYSSLNSLIFDLMHFVSNTLKVFSNNTINYESILFFYVYYCRRRRIKCWILSCTLCFKMIWLTDV